MRSVGLIANSRMKPGMDDKAKRLEIANQERAEAAVKWEAADNRAKETGNRSDALRAAEAERVLAALDKKIQEIEEES